MAEPPAALDCSGTNGCFVRHYGMAYVRRRITKAGTVSTALVEAYRDQHGRPRQRILANLHGEPDPLSALAKLAATHNSLSSLREEDRAEPSNEGAGFVLVTERALTKYGHRIVQINRQLDVVERDMAALIEHCRPSDDEFQEAVQRYSREYREAFERTLVTAIAHKQAEAALRRKA
jgi:hypothetical protein